jgi:hypothetical protein
MNMKSTDIMARLESCGLASRGVVTVGRRADCNQFVSVRPAQTP